MKLPNTLEKAFCTYCGSEILVRKLVGAHRVPCKTCDGYGKVDICRACDGSGHCTWSTSFPGARQDILMMGYSTFCDNGICHACKGTGTYGLSSCPGCEGTGKCPRCFGTGKCPACRGLGMIPNPQGTSKCLECGGSGLIDPSSPSSAEAGLMCPECRRPWIQGDERCRYCGFKRNLCPKCGAIWITGSLTCGKCGFGVDKG